MNHKQVVIAAIMTTLFFYGVVAVCLGSDQDDIAVTIAAESCGEGVAGMEAVASTILNRSKAWHKTPGQVVRQKNAYYGFTANNRLSLYRQCQQTADRLARAVLARTLPDVVDGGLYFLLKTEKRRAWHKIATVKIGAHSFYK